MKKSLFAGAALALVVVAGDTAAQSSPIPFSLDGRIDYAAPTGDFGDAAEQGFSFGGGVSIGVVPGLGVYASFSQARFVTDLRRSAPCITLGPHCPSSGADDNAEAVDQGFSAGLTAALPRVRAVAPWVSAGAVFHQLEISGIDEEIGEDIGFEVGGGLALDMAPGVRLTPGIGYRRYSAEIPGFMLNRRPPAEVEYFTAGIGLNITF